MIAAHKNQGAMSGVFEVTFPAVLLVQITDVGEELLVGKLMGHANGSAKYDLTGPTWGHCIGGYSRDGVNSLSCENGFAISENVGKQRAKMSGVNVVAGTEQGKAYIAAFGWGNDANDSAVREAILRFKLANPL